MINAQGGIYGRKLVIVKNRDDTIGLQNNQQVQASLADDNAFATFVATLQFTGADLLAKAKQPTFIWNINPEMATPKGGPSHDNIFGSLGALCFSCGGHYLPWLAQKKGLHQGRHPRLQQGDVGVVGAVRRRHARELHRSTRRT